MAHVQVTRKDSIDEQVQQLEDHIAERAYQLFLEHAANWADPSTDWLTAEQEIVRRPAIELCEESGTYALSASLAGLDPQDIEIDITPTDLVITSEAVRRQDRNGHVLMSEFRSGRIFRSIHFPQPVAVEQAKAEYRNGLLTVTAPIAGGSRFARPNGNGA